MSTNLFHVLQCLHQHCFFLLLLFSYERVITLKKKSSWKDNFQKGFLVYSFDQQHVKRSVTSPWLVTQRLGGQSCPSFEGSNDLLCPSLSFSSLPFPFPQLLQWLKLTWSQELLCFPHGHNIPRLWPFLLCFVRLLASSWMGSGVNQSPNGMPALARGRINHMSHHAGPRSLLSWVGQILLVLALAL